MIISLIHKLDRLRIRSERKFIIYLYFWSNRKRFTNCKFTKHLSIFYGKISKNILILALKKAKPTGEFPSGPFDGAPCKIPWEKNEYIYYFCNRYLMCIPQQSIDNFAQFCQRGKQM